MKKSDTQYDATVISQNFAKASFVYAIAANDAYEKPSSLSESIPFPSSEKWLPEILSRNIPKTGFFAKSWVRRTNTGAKELVISYRGTSGDVEDWTRGNFFITNLFFIDNQFDNAFEFAKDSVNKSKERNGFDSIVFTGHSLGGGLAQYVQRYFKDSRAIVFDSSPNKGRIYSIFDWNKYPDNSLRIYEKGEVLEYIRKPLDFDAGYDESPFGVGKKTRWMSFYQGGPVAQHDMQDFAISLVKVAASTGHMDALDVIKQLEIKRKSTELLDPYYELNNPYNDNRRKLRESYPPR